VPSEQIWIKDGLLDTSLRDSLAQWPWITSVQKWEGLPERLLISLESDDGSGLLKMDQPLSSFAERRFGARYVRSEWIDFPGSASHAAA
jgi:CRISPR system Cascade subunit CasD